MLYQSWMPTRTNAILPMLNVNDNTSFQPNSYYVEKGNYIRATSMQLGYTLPASIISKAKIDRLRVYIQGQNLFTISKYNGIDPMLGTANAGQTEQWQNVDFGNYPNAKSIIFGVNVGF
jgi:TonB-dependent starch-binding outer membrane protein SusC